MLFRDMCEDKHDSIIVTQSLSQYYPDWEIQWFRLKPIIPIKIQIGLNRETHLSYYPNRRYSHPDWKLILPLRIQSFADYNTFCYTTPMGDTLILIESLFSQWGYNPLLTITPSVILSQWGDTLILIESLFSQWGYNPLLTTTPSVILSESGDNLILIETLFSQWGCTNIPQSGNPWVTEIFSFHFISYWFIDPFSQIKLNYNGFT